MRPAKISRIAVIAAISMATASSCRKTKLFGLVRLLSAAANVTTLSPRLLRKCQRTGGAQASWTPTFERDDRDKVVSPGIKLYNLRSVVDECSIGSHGPIFPATDRPTDPRNQCPADTAGLRRCTVRLSA